MSDNRISINSNNSNIIQNNNIVNNNEIINNNNAVNNQGKGLKSIEPHVFTATEKNLVNKFSELLSGKTPPSELHIIDPETNKESPELKKQLCQAAVKVATALMTSIPGKETTFGFVLGDFTVEIRRDPLGKFFMSVEGLQEENNIIEENLIIDVNNNEEIIQNNNFLEEEFNQGYIDYNTVGENNITDESIIENNQPALKQYNVDKRLEINDTTSKFSAMIMEDIINNPELYNQEIAADEYADKTAKKGTFGALEQMIVASEQSPKSCISRGLMAEALRAKLGIDPNELNNIGIRTISHWAAQSILDPKMTAASLRAEIKRYNSTPHILENVNSIEADKDMQMIESLLEKSPNIVNSKVDISNIGQVRTDPQEGMSQNQKLIHNFFADMFMPADTSLYDMNEGKEGNRIRQVMLQHPEAIKLILEEGYNKGSLALETLPASVRNTLGPVLLGVFKSYSTDYFKMLSSEEDKQKFGAMVAGNKVVLDLEIVKGLIAKTPFESLESIDKAVNQAATLVAEEQQQLVKDKFTATLLNNNEANKKSRFVPIPDRDPRKIIADIVKTPKPTPEQLQNEPERAAELKEQRRKELFKAYKELFRTYKEVILSIMQIQKVNATLYPSDRNKHGMLTGLKDAYYGYINMCGLLPPENYMSDEGSKYFEEALENEISEKAFEPIFTVEYLESQIAKFTAEKDGKLVLQTQSQDYLDYEPLKGLNIDLKSPSLSQMASEPDEFDKPGMGKLIKNVLMSYFSTQHMEAKMPEGITPELKTLAETLAASKDVNPKLPADLSDAQKNLVNQAISSIREANRFNSELPSLLKTRQVDKRSMISSMIRYSDDKTSEAAKLGAMLKGAGPLMHKLLQGLELPGMDQDFKTALDDMKSNLSPIDPKYVQAQMLKIVDNSNNTIKSMSIKKPLGAASVGQAFLVTVTPAQGEPYDAVLKVIRPEVSVKTKREFEQFMIEARGIPGMADTYKGLYEQYKKEFSLELEANNIKLGQQVYSDGIDSDRVETMSLVDGVPATETSMLIKLAPGDTLDRYIKTVKARIDELKRTTAKTVDEYINNRREMQTLLKQMADINTSLGVTAKKWINKSIFGTEGFFHGDMHPGNLMVAPADPSDPQSKTKITIIDYGNASQLTKAQTNALLKINVACSFGGIYQFEATPQEKPTIEKHTVSMFIEGFKALLSEEDRKIFEKREKELTDNVIKPILLKGTKSEVGIRLSLLIKKLQQAGITIPGAISNMAESEKRLANGIDELNVLMDEIGNMLDSYHLDNITTGADPCYNLIRDSVLNGITITQKRVDEVVTILNYDYKANEKIVQDLAEHQQYDLAPNQAFDKADFEAFMAHKKEIQKEYEKYRKSEIQMTNILLRVDSGFKYSLNEMWENRIIKFVGRKEENKKLQDMVYGNYLKSPKEADPLYELHKQFLEVRSKVSDENLKKLHDCEYSITSYRNDEGNFDTHLENRKTIAELSKDPNVAAYMDLRLKMANIIKQRMIESAKTLPEKIPNGKLPGLIDKKQDFTTATLELVQNKISGETDAQTIKNAISFGGELGYNALSLTFNIGGARDYFTIVGNSFDKNNNNN